MASRRDQLHSYQFMLQRVVSSIMVHETDPEQAPLRRGVGAIFAGLMIAAVIAAGYGVAGLITGSIGSRWQAEGAIVIERETGAQFVFRGGTLQSVLNYASARLVSGVPDPGTHRVPGKNLAGFPRIPTVGIPGAPDSLPSGRVLGPPWTICSAAEPDPAGPPRVVTSLWVGEPVPGGTTLADRGMLVRDATDGTRYLIWNSHRYRIAGPDPDRVVRSLYGASAPELRAGTAWLDTLPAGEDLAPVEVPDRGAPSPAVSGARIGDLLSHPVAAGRQHYLVRADGLAPLSELQQLVFTGEYGVEPAPIQAAAASALPTSEELTVSGGAVPLPPTTPELAPPAAAGPVALCAETGDEPGIPPLVSYGGDLSAPGAVATGGASPAGTRLADLVRVPSSQVAVVRALPVATATGGAFQLVTDLGQRFPVPSEAVLETLGYSAADAVDMPAALVQRIPSGPTLDPAAALQPAAG